MRMMLLSQAVCLSVRACVQLAYFINRTGEHDNSSHTSTNAAKDWNMDVISYGS